MIESSERLWMMRPSCSVIEQKVQPPKQPRMMSIEKRIISYAGILSRRRRMHSGCGTRAIRQLEHASISAVVSGIGGGLSQTSRRRALHQRARVAGVGLEMQHARWHGRRGPGRPAPLRTKAGGSRCGRDLSS